MKRGQTAAEIIEELYEMRHEVRNITAVITHGGGDTLTVAWDDKPLATCTLEAALVEYEIQKRIADANSAAGGAEWAYLIG